MGKKLNQFHTNKLHGLAIIDQKKKSPIRHGRQFILSMNSIIAKNVVFKRDG